VPEILSEQFFSLGYSLQSINLRDCGVGLADMFESPSCLGYAEGVG
jgi:hypothetical protein